MSYEEEGKELIESEMAFKREQGQWAHDQAMMKMKSNKYDAADMVFCGAIVAIITTGIVVSIAGIIISNLS